MPRRLLALVAAIGMVAGAFAVRGWLDRREEDKANPPGLVCIPELADLCRRIAENGEAPVNVTVEPPGQTARRMVALNGADGIDGWLTLSHWPAIAEAQRQNRGLPAIFASVDNPVLARSPVVLSVWPDRAAVIRENCGGQIEWKCLGAVAQKRLWKDVASANAQRSLWGPVKIGIPDAADGATGLVAFGAATTNYFGRPDVSNIDFEDDAYRAWAGGLVGATPAASRPPDYAAVLAQGPSVADVYAGLEAEVSPLLSRYARGDKPQLIYPSPVATADLVLATVPGRTGDRLRDIVQDAVDDHLAELGWRVGTAPRNPALPPEDSLPDPGTLDALRQVWKEAA